MAIPRNRLAELRNTAKLTQDEVGKLLDIDGTTVSKHENSERSLSDDMIRAYARLYKVQTHELFLSSEEIKGDDTDSG